MPMLVPVHMLVHMPVHISICISVPVPVPMSRSEALEPSHGGPFDPSIMGDDLTFFPKTICAGLRAGHGHAP